LNENPSYDRRVLFQYVDEPANLARQQQSLYNSRFVLMKTIQDVNSSFSPDLPCFTSAQLLDDCRAADVCRPALCRHPSSSSIRIVFSGIEEGVRNVSYSCRSAALLCRAGVSLLPNPCRVCDVCLPLQAMFASFIPEITDILGSRSKYGGSFKKEPGKR